MKKYVTPHLLILISCWLVINGLLFCSMGVKYAIDTARFETEANAWLHGRFEPSYHFWYSGYIGLLFISKSIFHSIYASIFFQYIFSLVASICFYKGLCRLLKNTSAAFWASLLVICYLPIQQWNRCLLTESFFISLILVFVWAFSLERNTRNRLLLFLIAVVASTVRPNGGILFISCCFIYGMHSMRRRYFLFFLTGGILCILVLLHYFTGIFYQFLLDSFNKGEIICGYTQYTAAHTTHILNDPANGSITKIAALITAEPLKSLQLFTGRFMALWADIRPYYSFWHNMYISVYLLPAYAAALIGFIQYRNIYAELKWFTLLYCGIHSILIMLTYADWDGRFLAPLLPVVFIWSGMGMYFSILFLTRKKTDV